MRSASAIPCDPALRLRLVRAAQGLEAPDLLLRGGSVWNAFTGEVLPGDVAVCGDRIAWAGPGPWPGEPGPATEVVDAAGRVAVPGYIEPHTHPWPFLNPLSLSEEAACRGTTCLVYDELLLHYAFGPEGMAALTGALSQAALGHVYWVARIASQSRFRGEEEFFRTEVLADLLGQPHFACTGEMPRWIDFLDPAAAPRLLAAVELARSLGKFADGHTAGVSARRLPALAAVGLKSCHEAITAEEATARLRQGFWVLLRHSSLREDLESLLPALREARFAERFAFTTDGAKAHHVREHGLTDYLIKIALDGGVDPAVAYRLATLNPAVFLGLDADLGAVAPGRVADVNLLADLRDPTPERVICRGRLVAEGRRLTVAAPSAGFPWGERYRGGTPVLPGWRAPDFWLPRGAPNPFPAGRLDNAVITRELPVALEEHPEGLWPALGSEPVHVLALTDRRGGWISRGVIANLATGLEGLATTYTTNGGTLVLGKSPEAMEEALRRLRALGGGMVALGEGGAHEFPLPLAGVQMPGGFDPAARAAGRFEGAMTACGYPHADPNYTLLFLSCDFLPDLRLTQAGWIRSKTGEVVLPSESDEAGVG